LRVYPDAETVQFPIADGGEGTLEAAVAAGYEERLNAVVGPILAPVGAAWAIRNDAFGGATAIIETAQASGLADMEPTPANALRAHSYGCGQLIAAALDAGATEIVLGVGGSAMSDAGSGALRALGLKPLDAAGNVVPLGGGSLAEVASLDVSGLDPRLTAVTFRIAVDVQNPLFGEDGAAHVFGPQKGADADAVELLDAGLRNWASVLRQTTGRDVNVAGAGAAGGFPASFLAFSNAVLEGGFELVAGLTGLAGKLTGADLVITGEGSLDSQSLTGKAPIALADAARDLGIPVIVVAGRILVTPEDLAGHGVVAAGQLLDLAGSPADAVANAAKYLVRATSQILEGA
jgi:glycerate kinase